MKKPFYILVVVVGVFVGFASFARATSIFDITYPIPELGGCESQQACKVYCDDSANKDACLSFAEKYGLVAKEKIEEAKKLPALGPGGCRGPEECRVFCDKPGNEKECLAFAEKYGMKVQGARGQDVSAQARLIKEQGGPGNCQSQKECRAYCDDPAHQSECIAFAEKHNLIDKKEIKAAKQVMERGGPGGCRAEKECKAFCDKPENLEVCLVFAEEHGMIGKEEAERARKMSNKPGPGGCVGEACRDYCENTDHFEECIAFAEANNLMPKEEIEKAKRMGNKPGPGGCLGRQCEDFCRKPENQKICFQFAVENNLIPPEEVERAKKMKRIAEESGPGGCRGEEECRAYCENPEHVEECFDFAKQNGLIDEKEIKMMERGREMAKKVREASGPGGCRGEEECRAYCENPEHVEECLAFAVEHGGVQKDEARMMLEKFAQSSAGLSAQAGESREFPGRNDPRQPIMPPQDFEIEFEKRFERFERFRELEWQFRKPPEMMQNFQGPGGCENPEDCIKYCSDSANRSECAKFNPSTSSGQAPSVGAPPPGEIFRQAEIGTAGIYGRPEDLRRCGPQPPVALSAGCRLVCGDAKWESICEDKINDLERCGPKSAMPTPQGCVGPICKDGRWDFECKNFNTETMPFRGEGALPMSTSTRMIDNGVVCTQEYRPVCGANNRTYPNECFAKRDNISVVKSGPCEALNFERSEGMAPSPEGVRPPEGIQPPPDYSKPSYYPPGGLPPASAGGAQAGENFVPQYTQPPVTPEQQFVPPQSRRVGSSLLSNLLQAFSNALRMR